MNKIPIHWFHNQAFCEYEIFLAQVKGIPDPSPNREDIEEGRLIHTELLKSHEAGAILTDKSILELATEAQLSGVTSVLRELLVVSKRMIGSIDEVWIASDGAYVVEDKPRSKQGKPFLSETRQAQGYASAFKECHSLPVPIITVVRDRSTGDWLWQKLLDEEDERKVNEVLDRIEGILGGIRQAEPTNNPNKCRYCRWSPFCDKSLIKE